MYYEVDWGEGLEHTKFMSHLNKERLYEFLAGLNRDLDEVRGYILGRTPLPTIGEAFTAVRREENHRRVMMGDSKEPKPVTNYGHSPTESSALVSRDPQSQKIRAENDSKLSRSRDRLWCNYYNRTGHTKEKCFKLQGYPGTTKIQKENKALLSLGSSSTTTPVPTKVVQDVRLTKSQLETFHKLLGAPISHGSLAIQGIAFNITSKSSNHPSWILDSGASDHMTGNLSLFHMYSPCHSQSRIRIANGSYSSIAGIGAVRLTKEFSLEKVLHEQKSRRVIGTAKGDHVLITPDLSVPLERNEFSSDEIPIGSKLQQPNPSEKPKLRPPEIIVYSRKHFPPKNDTTAVPNSSNSEDCPVSDQSPGSSDIDLPIAVRKGIRAWHVKYDCPQLKRKGQSKNKHKAHVATWSDEEGSDEEEQEVANLCLMAFEEDSKENEHCYKARETNPNSWYLDSGCSRHMIGDKNRFSEFNAKNGGEVTFGDDSKGHMEGIINTNEVRHDVGEPSSNEETKDEVTQNPLENPTIEEREVSYPREYNHVKDGEIIGTRWVFRNKFDESANIVRNKARLVAQETQEEGIDYDETYAPVARMEAIRIKFEMSMMGELSFFLGLQIKQRKDGIFINQAKYIKDMLKKFGLENGKPHGTPMSSSTKLDVDEGAVKRIFRYLKDTPSLGLWSSSSRSNQNRPPVPHPPNPIPPPPSSLLGSCFNMPECRRDELYSRYRNSFQTYRIREERIPSLQAMVDINFEYLSILKAWKFDKLFKLKPIVYQQLVRIFYSNANCANNLPCEDFLVSLQICIVLFGRECSQEFGTFAPVAKLNTVRVLLSLAVNLDWPLIQLNVKNAFLNGDLSEEVYMDFPPGFEEEKWRVCRLKKSLYILKQSPRAWFSRFAKAMTSRKYTQGQYMHAPKEKHLEAVYRMLRYLKGTPGKGLHFKKNTSPDIELYTDADWAGSVYCDNQAAVTIAHNPVHHDHTKHVEIDRHFIRKKVNSEDVCITYLPTKQQVADLLTKSLNETLVLVSSNIHWGHAFICRTTLISSIALLDNCLLTFGGSRTFFICCNIKGINDLLVSLIAIIASLTRSSLGESVKFSNLRSKYVFAACDRDPS
ncbi:hypothetical protein F3Y22_tig00012036pilonHSYRG00007 [Hibiscus syriacus]|uniref:Reverse transcriptase Ty1/copia-type domain-containing protein n=1 Tax=Hibiscus syriacus TaxID=106335 RepID=A0A6A3C9E2_HIBSY|nr:hypothetical protein F3Y22_tig00012036pilonHSYRG00007 [Hibiscus syriacus]